MGFAQWIEDRRWAANARRARRIRRGLGFSARQRFDDALRPSIDSRSVIAYPDAIYHISIDDLCRAIEAAYDVPTHRRVG